VDIQPVVASFVLSEFVNSGLLELIKSVYSRCESLSWSGSQCQVTTTDLTISVGKRNLPHAAIPGCKLVSSTVHALQFCVYLDYFVIL